MKEFYYENRGDWGELDKELAEQPLKLVLPNGAVTCLHRP